MNKLRILIVGDEQIFLTGITSLLGKEPGFEIVGQTDNRADAIIMAQKLKPDTVLIDLDFSEKEGVSTTAAINNGNTGAKIIALTSKHGDFCILDMVRAGAKGFVLKSASLEEMVLAIRTIERGGSYFSKDISNKLFALLGKAEPVYSRRQRAKMLDITNRELEVLEFIAQELTNKEIAARLFISPRTVETHRRNLVQKLRVKNTAGLVKYYLSHFTQNGGQLVEVG